MENRGEVLERINSLLEHESLTVGVRKSLGELALELEKVDFLRECHIKPVRLGRARKILTGLVFGQHLEAPVLTSLIEQIGIPRKPKRNDKIC